MQTATSTQLIESLRQIVGHRHVLTQDVDTAPYLTDWRGNYTGKALAVVLPASTDEVARVVTLCAATRTAIVPQGGNTGLVGGGIPDASATQIVLSLKRMNRVRGVDAANCALAVEAGAILQNVQAAADEAGLYFPLSLAAEGSCTIGGNLSTNAGGTAVLRYGNTRDLVLGIEAVLPDGRVWDGMKALRKDNTGYDLKHLMMGAEGTLGIITACVLKLYPKPRNVVTAMVAVRTPADAIALLARARETLGDRVSGIELMARNTIAHTLALFPAMQEPFSQAHDWQVLLELTDTMTETPLDDALAGTLAPMFDSGAVADAVIATSKAQQQAMWSIREHIPEAEKQRGKSVKHDIALPISRIPEFITRANAALQAAFPNAEVICFGHVGDGNLHYNLSFPGSAPSAEQTATANKIVYDLLDELDGSISAEHGLGQLKRDEITKHKSVVALDAMRAIKRALDPHNIMNPGKVL